MAPKKQPDKPDKSDKKKIAEGKPKTTRKRQASSSDIESSGERQGPVRQGGTPDPTPHTEGGPSGAAAAPVASPLDLDGEDAEEEEEVEVSKTKTRRTKRPIAKLPAFVDNQDAIVDWYKEQKCLYDPGHKDSSNKDLKEALLTAKAKELGVTCKF